MEKGNLFADLPDVADAEHFDTLVELERGRVERIVSLGHSSPPGFWYDQDDSEWVLVLRGRAALEFEGEGDEDLDLIELGPGDYVNIPPHRRHRVAWTATEQPTVWLTVRY